MWAVVYLPDAERERDKLPAGERHALYNAVAPEAQHDRKGFALACGAATQRLSELEE